MSEGQKESLHSSFGNVDSSHLQGLEFFADRPHFATHVEGAMARVEENMRLDPENTGADHSLSILTSQKVEPEKVPEK